METVAAALQATGFSPTLYRTENDDLKRALADDKVALWHFVAYCGDLSYRYPIMPSPRGFARWCALRTSSRLKAEALAHMLGCFGAPEGALWTMRTEDRKRLLGDLRTSVMPGGRIYFMIGDSHSNLYRRPVVPEGDRGPFLVPQHILCTGSSARGLANRASRSGSGARLATLAQSLPDCDMELFFKFGQVDVEFSFTFERIRAGKTAFDETDFVRFCERSVNAYVDFIAEHFRGRPVTIMSIFPPTLSDAAWHEGYTNAQVVASETEQALDEVVRGIRGLEIPSISERTRHHAIFNAMLEAKTADAGFSFLDDFTGLIGPAGTAHPRYFPTHEGRDHHLEHSPTVDALFPLIRSRVASKGLEEPSIRKRAGT